MRRELAVLLLAVVSSAPSPVSAAGAPQAPSPVVVELFTSQGCSTCPPADQLLARLGAEAGANVVALSFHVDFWNHLGWSDPFSSAEWTRRQEAYGRRFASELFTPEAVVAGAQAVLGSDERALRAAIAAAAERPAVQVALEVEPSADSLRARIELQVPAELQGRKLDLLLAVVESGLSTAVGRGENAGRLLSEDFVVRSLSRAGRLGPRTGATARFSATLPLASEWSRGKLRVAAFLQDPSSLGICGAAVSPASASEAGPAIGR